MKKIFENLLNVRGIIMIILTVIMGVLLFKAVDFNKELLMLFCTSYGIVLSYFFSSNKTDNHE